MKSIHLLLLCSGIFIGTFITYSDAYALPGIPIEILEQRAKEKIAQVEAALDKKTKDAEKKVNAQIDKLEKRVILHTEEVTKIIFALKNICEVQANYDAIKKQFLGKGLISTWSRVVHTNERIHDQVNEKRVAIKDVVSNDSVEHTECSYDPIARAYVETSYTLDLKKKQPECVPNKAPSPCDPHKAGLQ